ncbi:MAG: hypothetical protein R3C49_23835 [Planctomycetaceae bacterium]
MIALTLGIRMQGHESAVELQSLLDHAHLIADQQPVLPFQQDLATWLKVSLDEVETRQAASVRLWDCLQERGYSLVDIPVNLRKKVFGGSLEIQKRLTPGRWRRIVLRKLTRALRTLIFLIAVTAVLVGLWYAWQIGQSMIPGPVMPTDGL